MKSKEELEVLKKEYEDFSEKVSKLTDEEMEQIVGAKGINFGKMIFKCDKCGYKWVRIFKIGVPFREDTKCPKEECTGKPCIIEYSKI